MGRVSWISGERVYLDTNIVIYAIEGFAEYEGPIQQLLEAIDAGDLTAVTSELTLAEALIKPLKENHPKTEQAYRDFLTTTSNFEIISISRDILEIAAQWSASTKLKLADAIYLSTALHEHCDTFLTNDSVFRSLNLAQVKLLSDVRFNP